MPTTPRSPTFSPRVIRDPSIAIRSGPENYQNRLLNLYATPVGLAAGFDVIRVAARPTDFGYRNEALLASLTATNPFALYDWPIPKSYPPLPTSFVYGNPELFKTLPPFAMPFAQHDWPVPLAFQILRNLVGQGVWAGFFHSPGQPGQGQPPYFSPPPLLPGPFPRIVVPRQPITVGGHEVDRVWWRHFSDTTQAINMLVAALNQARADIVKLKNTDLINQ